MNKKTINWIERFIVHATNNNRLKVFIYRDYGIVSMSKCEFAS